MLGSTDLALSRRVLPEAALFSGLTWEATPCWSLSDPVLKATNTRMWRLPYDSFIVSLGSKVLCDIEAKSQANHMETIAVYQWTAIRHVCRCLPALWGDP